MRRGWTDGQRYITKYGKIPVVLGSEPPTPTPTGPEGRDERNQLAFCRSRRSLSRSLSWGKLTHSCWTLVRSVGRSVGRRTISSVEWGRFGMDSGVQRREERERERETERGGGQRRRRCAPQRRRKHVAKEEQAERKPIKGRKIPHRDLPIIPLRGAA